MADYVTPERLFLDDLKWMQEHCWIIAKDGKLKRLTLNKAQHKVKDACLRQLRAGKPIRIIGLKARQLGFTTFVQALFFSRTARRRGVKAVLLSHTDESKAKIWGMQAVFVDGSGIGDQKKRFGEADGPLVWRHNSMLSCMTAGGKHVGHGETINLLHLSEFARYGEGQSPEQQARVKAMVAEIRSALADTPDSMEFVESTANGFGNEFQIEWQAAVEGRNDYEPVFIAWFEEPEYQVALLGRNDDLVEGLSAYEQDLRGTFGLLPEQLAWRRWVIANKIGGDERKFREQFPSTPEEAFLVTGSPVFDAERIDVYSRNTRPPVWRGDIAYEAPTGWALYERADGPLQIWRWPEETDAYAIGADTAECLDLQADRDAAVVRSRRTKDVVATLAGHWEPGEFAERLAALGWLYRTALLAVERNHPGPAVVGALAGKLGGRPLFGNLYCYERVDKATGKRQTVIGFPTTRDTKRAAVEAEMALLREGSEDCPSVDLLAEARTFINGPNGKMEAVAGARDDLVVAWIITAAVINDIALPTTTPAEAKAERLERFYDALATDGEKAHEVLAE